MRGRKVSDLEQLAAAERLETRGYVRRCGEDRTWGDGTVSRHYEITDEGRAYMREQDDLSDLTVDGARGMSARDLRELWGGHPVADRQLGLRAVGGARVRGVLVACGEAHSGTGGWHVIPYVTPDRRIGYVDTAKGRAYLTDERLSEEAVVALTVPGQTPGAKASGAAAWSSPDAGGGAGTEAPDGWVQLVIDIRTHEPVEQLVLASPPTLVAYGLVTCYSRRGATVQTLVSEWPLDDDQRGRIHALAGAWLEDLREQIGPDPGYSGLVEPGAADAAHALHSFAVEWEPERGTVRRALRDHRIDWVADAAGEHRLDAVVGARRIDAIGRALSRWAAERLGPMVSAIPAELEAYTADGQSRGVHDRRERLIRAAAAELLDHRMDALLRITGASSRVGELAAQCREILYERGAIVTDEGMSAGVTCTSPPPQPQAVRGELAGTEVWYVPHGAEAPEDFGHVLVITVDHAIRCRPEDAERLSRMALGMRRPS